MSVLNLGQMNIRPCTNHELYRNESDRDATVTIALTFQTAFTLAYGSSSTTLDECGAITLVVPRKSALTISHCDEKIMQPVQVQISVA